MLLIDQYAYINRLKSVHPAEKMALTFSLLLFSTIVRDELISIIIFIIMSVAIIQFARIPWQFYLKLLLLPSFFLLTSLVTIVFSFAKIGTTIPEYYKAWTIGKWIIFITPSSIDSAIQLACVVLGSISCLYYLILTTSAQSIFHVLRKLRVPAIFIEMCELTYRFIFVFIQSAQQIYTTQQSRLGYNTPIQWLRSIALLITSLFIDVLQRSSQLSKAMQSRSLETSPLYWEEQLAYSKKNWIMILCICSCIISIYILKEILG